MSKSTKDEEEDIYSDLPDFQYDDTLKKLETSKKALEEQVATIQKQLEKLYEENKKLNEVNHNLAENISSLYKTANNELKRKDRVIQELRDENDKLIFRKKRFQPKQEYSVINKDNGYEDKNLKSINNCPYKEEVGIEICKESLVSSQNVPQTLLPHNSEQTTNITLLQANTNSCLKSNECDVTGSDSFCSGNEQKELNRESKFSIKSKTNAMNLSESSAIYSKIEKPSPKPEYLEKHMAFRIKEMSSKYSSRSSSVIMANTVKSKYSKSRSSRSKTPFDKTDNRISRVSRGRSPHRRDSDRQPDISFMRSVSRYSRSRSPPRRNKTYDTKNRYHYSHSKERKYNFKNHINSLDKFDSKHESSSKKISSKSKERESCKYSMPVRSRYEDKISKLSHSSKVNSVSKNDYEMYKSKVNTFCTNDVPLESKRNTSKETLKKTEAEAKTSKSNVLEHLPTAQEELKYSLLTDAKLVEVSDSSVNVNISALNRPVDNSEQDKESTVISVDNSEQAKESTVISSNAVDKTNSCVESDEHKDIVEKNATSKENLEIGEIKICKENSDENKCNFQSPVKEKECNTNLLKTSPTLQDPAIFKGGSVSICMFNEQANFTRKRRRAKLVITNKPLSNSPSDPEIISVSSESRRVITSNDKSTQGKHNSKHDFKHSSINDSPELKKFKWSSEVENSHITEHISEDNNAYNPRENEDHKISQYTDVPVNKVSSNRHVNVPNKPKILAIKDLSHEDSRQNNGLLNSYCEPTLILTTNDKILIDENVIPKDTVEKRKSSGDDNICGLSKILVSNKENIHSTAASKDKNTKSLIGKDKNSKDFLKDISLEEGEIIDEISPDESGVGISNVDEILPTKFDREKIKERTNQRRSSGNSRRSNSITRQTARVKNAFGNNICERRSPSELFTGDKSLRKINKKRDSHSKIIRSESQHPDDDNNQGNRISDKRKATCNESKLKQRDSKSENRNRQKSNHSHPLKISEKGVDNEHLSTVKKIQNVDKEHSDNTGIKIDLKKSDPIEKLKERNQKPLKQPSSIEVNMNVLNSTASKENTCNNIDKRKTNKLCDLNQEKTSNVSSDTECLNNKSVSNLQSLISDDPINKTLKDVKAQHTCPEKQEITVTNKYSTTAKIFDKVESITNMTQIACSDISCDMVSSDTNSKKAKSDIHVVNNVSDNCDISVTFNDVGYTSQEGNDSSIQAHKRKNARMTRSKINSPSTKGKNSNGFSGKLVKGNGDSEGLQPNSSTSNEVSVINKVFETPSFADCLNKDMNENSVDKLKFNSHSTTNSTKTLSRNESKKHKDAEISSQSKDPENHQIGIEKLVMTPDTNRHIDIKYQINANFDIRIDENCDTTNSTVTPLENHALHSFEQEETMKLSEIEIKSPLLTTDSKTNEQIDHSTNQIMSDEELMKILVGSPPSVKKNSANTSDEKLPIGTDSIKTPEPSQQSVKKTIIMHRRTRVRMLQDSPIHTFTISSKPGQKNISNSSTPQTDRKNEFINKCDITPQKKLQVPCALSKVAVSKDTVDDRENYVNSDAKDKSTFTNHNSSNTSYTFSDVFGSDSSEDSGDRSDDSVYLPKKRRRVGNGQTKKKKKIVKVKIKM